MKRKPRLTTRGKHALFLCLTLLGCMAGLTAAMIIRAVCTETGSQNNVFAKEQIPENESSQTGKETVTPQWLFYQSLSEEADEIKREMDLLINRWTKGNLTDDELSEQMLRYWNKKERNPSEIGVQSQALCLFSSANALPDYARMLSEHAGLYDFIGVYTDGECDENGRLICYYWEAGVKE